MPRFLQALCVVYGAWRLSACKRNHHQAGTIIGVTNHQKGMTQMRKRVRKLFLCLVAALALQAGIAEAVTCSDAIEGSKQVFWGDLHVHTAYSLDAYSFGTLATPAEAYAFARGSVITLADGSRAYLERPLDFAAVTDHAEWFDFMYLCAEGGMEEHPDCKNLAENASPAKGIDLFRQYVVPTITLEEPQAVAMCQEAPDTCRRAWVSQWERVQQQAERANEPCEFTSFVGYEWSATHNYRHTHRNVIFATSNVPAEAFDYIRYPKLQQLFDLLATHCRLRDGCDVITIPHNTNMGDGTTFDVESETDRELSLRTRFERLVEIYQEKGNSECLSPLGATDEKDCDYEIWLTKQSRAVSRDSYTSEEWERMRSTYVRGLLKRGIAAYQRSGDSFRNPLQLGVIGSTDNHAATPGFVTESEWHGPIFGIGDIEATMTRIDWNPGGLIAVRAEENTRASLFAAMKRREVYATSGPRIELNFEAGTSGALSCEAGHAQIAMGGEFTSGVPSFRLHAARDRTPLARIEIVKGSLVNGSFAETVTTLWEGRASQQCLTWQDATFAADAPAFWYVRVLEAPTPRWSAYHCQRAERCDDFPDADRSGQERAWSSPIWYLPR